MNVDKLSQNFNFGSKYSEELKNFETYNKKNTSEVPNKLDTREKNYSKNPIIEKYTGGRYSRNSKNISDVIRKAGGITSLSDLTRVKVIRNIFRIQQQGIITLFITNKKTIKK